MTDGIDVSRWQGQNFDFTRAKKDHGIHFAILKIGGADDGLYQDSCFASYYQKAKAAGLSVGLYFFGNATTPAEARKEADFAAGIVAGRKFEYPFFYDVESKAMMKLSKRKLTDVIIAFCERIEELGFWAGIYSSTSVYDGKVYDGDLKRFTHWIADWRGSKPALKSGAETQIWQTGSTKNYQDGIEVDNDICYVDYYEDAVKRKGLNNYGKPRKTNEQIAREVWAGLWGNGEQRRRVLTAKGYNYDEIQKLVNKLKGRFTR